MPTNSPNKKCNHCFFLAVAKKLTEEAEMYTQQKIPSLAGPLLKICLEWKAFASQEPCICNKLDKPEEI